MKMLEKQRQTDRQRGEQTDRRTHRHRQAGRQQAGRQTDSPGRRRTRGEVIVNDGTLHKFWQRAVTVMITKVNNNVARPCATPGQEQEQGRRKQSLGRQPQ